MVSISCIARQAFLLTAILFLPSVTAALLPNSLYPRAAGAAGAASYYVPNLPGLQYDPTRPLHVWAGHIPSTPPSPTKAPTDLGPHLYFLLVKARKIADRERLIIWFNGGPGCSSFDGSMMEIGPWRMDGQGGLTQIEGGWEEYANVLYLDQPVGTGYSYASTDEFVHELGEAADQVVTFLRNFYDLFPEYETMDTWIAGESFAGQYIPYTADAVLRSSHIHTPLKGLAIGNGWIDGRHQYPAYYEFALKTNMVKPGTQADIDAQKQVERCKAFLNSTMENPVNIGECEAIMGAISESMVQTVDGQKVCVNVYDIRLVDSYPSCGMNWPPDLPDVYTYLQRPDVITALHATAKSEAWVECSGRVGSHLTLHSSPAAVTLLPGLLEQIPVMLFAGDQDFICNYVGQERLIEALTWNGDTGLGDAETLDWYVNSTYAGTWQSARNLTYVKIAGASHMVGFDVPLVAHDMILRFMGVDYVALVDGAASIPSSVGGVGKPSLIFGDTEQPNMPPPPYAPSKDPSVWRSYYNSGTTALVFLLIVLALGLLVWIARRRRRRYTNVSADQFDVEESIPLSNTDVEAGSRGKVEKGMNGSTRRKVTEESESATPIFDVGDDGEEEGEHTEHH